MYKNVLSVGIFDILHPGHIRLFEFAKSVSQHFTVAIIDDNKKSTQDINVRKKEVLNCELVDDVIVLDENFKTEASLEYFDAVIQGIEYEDNDAFNNLIGELSETVKLIYWGAGIKLKPDMMPNKGISRAAKNFKLRHSIDEIAISKIIDKMKKLHVVVIGDTIVDRYLQAETVGISREDPTMVVRPIDEKLFLGGAGIVAAHAAAIAANVTFISKGGTCNMQKFVDEKLQEYGIQNTHFITQREFKITTKTRIRTGEKTQLRVNDFDDFILSNAQTHEILLYLSKLKQNPDLVIFSDFSLGTFSKNNAQKLVKYFTDRGIFVSADSQVSSRVGDLSLFVGADYICPTEVEARSTLRDQHSNIRELGIDLINKIKCTYCVQTLGSEGVYITEKPDDVSDARYDSLPALSSKPIDIAGAGDAFLVSSSCALAAGADIWRASLIGSLASKAQVERYGNIPLNINDLNL